MCWEKKKNLSKVLENCWKGRIKFPLAGLGCFWRQLVDSKATSLKANAPPGIGSKGSCVSGVWKYIHEEFPAWILGEFHPSGTAWRPQVILKGVVRNCRGTPWKDGLNSLHFTCWVDPKTIPRSFAPPGTSLPCEHSLSFIPPWMRRGHLALSSLGNTSRKNFMPERAPRARAVKLHLAPRLNSLPSPKQQQNTNIMEKLSGI